MDIVELEGTPWWNYLVGLGLSPNTSTCTSTSEPTTTGPIIGNAPSDTKPPTPNCLHASHRGQLCQKHHRERQQQQDHIMGLLPPQHQTQPHEPLEPQAETCNCTHETDQSTVGEAGNLPLVDNFRSRMLCSGFVTAADVALFTSCCDRHSSSPGRCWRENTGVGMNCGCDVERWEKNLEKLIDTLFSWIRVVKKQILLVQEAELLHRGYCSGKSAAYPPISRIELRSNPHKLATLRKAILSTQLRVIEVLSEAWKQLSVVPGSDTLLSHLRTCRICKGDLSVVDDSQNTVESSLWILQQKQRLCSRLCSHFSSISACYITSLNCRLSKESNCACTELNTLIGQVVSVVEEETHFLTTPTSINPPTPPFTPGKTLNLNNSFGENCDQLRCKLPSLESRLLLCKEMVLQYSEQYTDVPNNAPLQKPTLSEINDCFASVSTTFAYFLEKWRDMSTTWLSENENSPQSPSTHNNTEQPPHQQANTEPPTQTQNLEVGSQTPPPHNSDSTFTATSTTATSTVVLESVTSDTEEDSGNESPEKQRERRQQRAEIARQRRLMMQEQQQRAEELHTLMSELSAVLQVRKKETLS